jgi:hypothetical protein
MQAHKAQADADAYKIATRELQTALDTLTKSREMSEVEKEYLDTVRRMAVVQVSIDSCSLTRSHCFHGASQVVSGAIDHASARAPMEATPSFRLEGAAHSSSI